jgi:hypothetical protein
MEKTKLVIFKEFNRYCVTSEDNYNKFIRDEYAISKFPPFYSKQEAVDALIRWGIADKEDIVDMTGECNGI